MAAMPRAHGRSCGLGTSVAANSTRLRFPARSIGWILFQSRHYDEAIHELRSALAVRPDDASALTDLGFVLIANNQPEDAIPVLEKAISVSNRSPAAIGVLIRAYAHAGRRSDALRLLAELKRRRKSGLRSRRRFCERLLRARRKRRGLRLARAGLQGAVQYSAVRQSASVLRPDPRRPSICGLGPPRRAWLILLPYLFLRAGATPGRC